MYLSMTNGGKIIFCKSLVHYGTHGIELPNMSNSINYRGSSWHKFLLKQFSVCFTWGGFMMYGGKMTIGP